LALSDQAAGSSEGRGRGESVFEQSEEGYGSLRLEAGRLEAAVELVNLVWFGWFLLCFEPNQLNKPNKPNKHS
jgi:hypothetical protein